MAIQPYFIILNKPDSFLHIRLVYILRDLGLCLQAVSGAIAVWEHFVLIVTHCIFIVALQKAGLSSDSVKFYRLCLCTSGAGLWKTPALLTVPEDLNWPQCCANS